MPSTLPIEQFDSWELAREKINNSFSQLNQNFINSIPYIQNGYWYVNWQNTGVPVSNGNLALRVNDWILQWKNADSSMDWQNLLKLSDLRWDDWKPGEKIYGADIVDITTELDSERWITYLVITLDDGTTRRVKLFKWNDLYKFPTQQVQQAVNASWNTRTLFAMTTDNAVTENKTAVLVNPESLAPTWENREPQVWDRIMLYFGWTNGGSKCDNPTLNLSWNGDFPIQLKNLVHSTETYNNRTYYYRFHYGAGTRIELWYLWNNKFITNQENDVVDIYTWETWNLINAIRELKRTRQDVTEEELAQIKARWEYDPKVYYYIKD